MNKLSLREYVVLVAEQLVKDYGNTLVENNTDLHMALAIVKKMQKYLYFHPYEPYNKREFLKWRKNFLHRKLNHSMQKVLEEEANKGWEIIRKYRLPPAIVH